MPEQLTGQGDIMVRSPEEQKVIDLLINSIPKPMCDLVLPPSMDSTEAMAILDEAGITFDIHRSDDRAVLEAYYHRRLKDHAATETTEFFGLNGLRRMIEKRTRGILD